MVLYVLLNMASSAASGSFLKNFLQSVTNIHPALQSSCDFIHKNLVHLSQKYEKMVIEEPERVAKLESTLNLMSFVLPGQFKSSELLSELVYFATRMLSLLHDVIYRKKFSLLHGFLWTDKTYLELSVTVLEYVEAFIELGAGRLWGEAGKWIVVFVLHIFKAVLKMVLLYSFDSGIQTSPSLPFVREKFDLENKEQSKIPGEQQDSPDADSELTQAWKEANEHGQGKSDVWSGKRSGRVIRSLSNAPPNGFRDWKLPSKTTPKDSENALDYYTLKGKLNNQEKTAELAFILRPIAHLSSMFVFGEKSWKPWLLSMAIDVSSLHCLQSKKVLYKMERDELFKRKASMLVYLLRSPFYDKYSKAKIMTMLTSLGGKVPGLGLICKPLLEYLPVWQRMYSHTWSN